LEEVMPANQIPPKSDTAAYEKALADAGRDKLHAPAEYSSFLRPALTARKALLYGGLGLTAAGLLWWLLRRRKDEADE
jgi:hypothetical protein